MGLEIAVNQLLTFTDEQMVGGQIFNKFPETPDEIGEFWSNVLEAMIQDIITVAVFSPAGVAAAKAAFAAAVSAVATVPGGGAAALSAGVAAVFLGAPIVLCITPNIIAVPPALDLTALIASEMAPYLIAGVNNPVLAANAFGNALKGYIESASWTVPPPAPAAPTPFVVLP